MMTKQQFIDRVHEIAGNGHSKTDTAGVVDAVFESIAEAVQTGQSFRWNGFGTFETRERPARDGRNPQTGQPMKIKASTTVGFRPAGALKDRVGQNGKAKTAGKKK